MTPALAVVAISALLLSWNDYLYSAVLLSVRERTVSVTQGQLFSDVDAPCNAMMAAAIVYVLPPIVLLFVVRRRSTVRGLDASPLCDWAPDCPLPQVRIP